MTGADGALKIVINSRDVTEHRALLEQFHHLQKVATVGRFVSSIVHEFNNSLQLILGNAEFLLESTSEPAARREIGAIKNAGIAAGDLSRQLLQLSRSSASTRQRVDVNSSIDSLRNGLQRLLGRRLNLVTRLEAEHAAILAPSGAIDQIIVNLVANARDAMGPGER